MRKIKLTGGNVGRHRRKIGNTILAWCLTLGVVAILGVVGVKIFLHMGRESLKKNAYQWSSHMVVLLMIKRRES